MTQQGFSFVELLITLGFVSLTLISVSEAIRYSEQNLAAVNQTLCAAQSLSNIAQALLSNQNGWTAALQTHWHDQAMRCLPNATLHIHPDHIEIDWPTRRPLNIHCEVVTKKNACLGLDLTK